MNPLKADHRTPLARGQLLLAPRVYSTAEYSEPAFANP